MKKYILLLLIFVGCAKSPQSNFVSSVDLYLVAHENGSNSVTYDHVSKEFFKIPKSDKNYEKYHELNGTVLAHDELGDKWLQRLKERLEVCRSFQ